MAFREWGPLHRALRDRQPLTAIEALIAAGADPNVRHKHGHTPLHTWAQAEGDPAVACTLIHRGADPNAQDGFGSTPLHDCCHSTEDDPTIARTLLDMGADPNAQNQFGSTPLHYCCGHWRDHPAIACTLVRLGADPNAQDLSGRTPMHDAVANGHSRVLRVLLDSGGNANLRDELGDTPLIEAVSWYGAKAAVVIALLGAGADPHAKSQSGRDAVDLACRAEVKASIVRALTNASQESYGARWWLCWWLKRSAFLVSFGPVRTGFVIHINPEEW